MLQTQQEIENDAEGMRRSASKEHVQLCFCVLLFLFLALLFFIKVWHMFVVSEPPGYVGQPPMLRYPYRGLKESMYDMYPPFMVSATWSADNCMGVQNTSAEWARLNGCVAVDQDTDGDGIPDGPLITRTAPLKPNMQMLFATGSTRPNAMEDARFPLDAVAVKFSWAIEQDSLDWDDFDVKLSTGESIKPDSVSLAPANDQNERQTCTLYGQFSDHSAGNSGDWSRGHLSSPGMVKVSVVSDLFLTNGTHRFNAKGAEFVGGSLNFELGAVLTMGLLRSYDPDVNPVAEGSDSCQNFPNAGVTHVLQAVTQGAASKDGVNAFNPDQVQLFTIGLQNGQNLRREAFVGLADIDGDDYTEICLRLAPGEAELLHTLTMNCDMKDPLLSWALPHGNLQGFAPCTDTQTQVIAHIKCPASILCR